MHTIRVLLADDHPIVRSGLRGELSDAPGIDVVAEAADGEAALARIRELRPDVAILDLNMPKANGFEVAKQLQDEGSAVAVVLLTAHKDESLLNKALDLGFKGFVLKDAAVAEIVDCIRAVHVGQHYISPQLSTFLLNRNRRSAALAESKPGLESLTPAERRVLQMIAEQQSTRQIADALCVSVRTVEHHRSNICAKLDLHGVNALTRFATAHRSEI
jgi:DNA-binding NarL/FixJ family response regulator